MSYFKWEVQYGDKTIPITANDVVETLGRLAGIANKEVATNEQIKSSVQMKIIYDMDLLILERVIQAFAGAIEQDAKKTVTKTIPGKRK